MESPNTSTSALGPAEFPVPNGIEAETGKPLPGLTHADLERIDVDQIEVRGRSERSLADHFAIADVDPNNLEEAGWCVLFASDADPTVKDALKPLLALRESQGKRLFKVFEGQAGVRPGEDARNWLERQGAGFFVVDPEGGVPLYILLVGSPERISFEFQYVLDLYWNVGRLHFDAADEYRTYAENVVSYETASTVSHRKHAALFCVKNDGDRATGMLHDQVAVPLATGSSGVKSLSGYRGFQLTSICAESATKDRLISLLRGREPGGATAFLFTGSHGVRFKIDDPSQREKQGALLCQDWPGYGPVAPEQIFTAADIPADASVQGLIHFLFACYGGGCPTTDNFGLATGQPPRLLVKQPIVARLPQRLLTKGALASLAHVDRAWAYSFTNSRSAPQVQEMRDVMVRILQGQRIGQAIDGLNMRWAVLAAELQQSMSERESTADQVVSKAELANRYVARNDARNYIVLGDPAVRLRTESMTS
jgi:hypothetical protein